MNTVKQTDDMEKTLGLRTHRARRVAGRLVALAAVCAGAYGGYVCYRNRQREAAAVSYETRSVERGSLTVTVSATGTLEPVNTVEVGSEVSGTLKSVEADYNDSVKKGQVLARIDTSKLEAEVLESEAALEAARAQVLEYEATVKEGESQLARLSHVRELSGGKVPSQYEYEAQEATVARARASLANAKAGVSKSEATLRVNRSDLEKAVIHSPVNGVVLTRKVEVGQTVAASMTTPVLFTLAEDLRQLELQVDVDEADVGKVREGQDATFTVDAYPDKHFPARITQVRYGSTTTDGVVTYTTVLKVNNDDLALRPGMTATAVITTKRVDDALLAPCAALRFEMPEAAAAAPKSGGSVLDSLLPHPPHHESKQPQGTPAAGRGPRVYVLRDGRPVEVSVTTGLTDGTRTELTSGALEVGAQVIVEMAVGRK